MAIHVQARLFVATGTPVQPHSSLGLEDFTVDFRWVRVPPSLFETVGYSPEADTVHGFCHQFAIPEPDEDEWLA